MRKPRRINCRGGSALEMAMILPWYLFLFIGAFDWGYYAHALISTESATRVAALYASTNSTAAADSTGICNYAVQELKISPNVGSSVTCPATTLPVIVSTSGVISGADGNNAVNVSVTYQTTKVIPIPGLLGNQATFYRVVQMRLRG